MFDQPPMQSDQQPTQSDQQLTQPIDGFEVCDLNGSMMYTNISGEVDTVNVEGNEVGGEIGLALTDNLEKKPVVGMKFGTVDELYKFYRSYGQRGSFPIRKRSSKKGKQ